MVKIKFPIKKPLIAFIVTLAIVSSLFVVKRGYDYLAVKGYITEAQRLADQGKYEQAVNTLASTDNKWTTNSIKSEIQVKIEKYKILEESSNNFEQAKLKYDFKDYQSATELFKKVLVGDVNYKSAQGWIISAEKKLAKGEGKEQGSVAGVNTQSSDISKDYNQIIPQTVTNIDDSPKLQKIKDLFARIGTLNGQLSVLNYIGTTTTSPCDIEKWSKQYLPNGEYNPNFILDPIKQNEIYQQCLKGQSSSSLQSSAGSIIKEIQSINKEIEAIIASCSTSQCSESYWAAVRTLESQGYIVR